MDKQLIIKQANDKLEELALEAIHYYATRKVDPRELLVMDGSPRLLQTLSGHLVAQIIGYVWAERVQLEDVRVFVEVPSSWWQHAKASLRAWANGYNPPKWMPYWLYRRIGPILRRLRVDQRDIETRVKFEHYVKYPRFDKPKGGEMWSRERAEYMTSIGVPEVRIDGAWRTSKRVAGWWKDED